MAHLAPQNETMGVCCIPFQVDEWTKQVQVTKRPVVEAECNRVEEKMDRRNRHYKKTKNKNMYKEKQKNIHHSRVAVHESLN